MEQWESFLATSGAYLLNVVSAVVILVVGWVVAWLVATLVRRGLARTTLHKKVLTDVGGEASERGVDLDRWIARAVFLVLMVFVLIAVFEALLLQSITAPLSEMLTVVLDYAPRIAGAALIFAAAWLLATVMRALIRRGLDALNLEGRLTRDTLPSDQTTLAQSIATTVYWLVFLLFLPALLGALELQGLLGPVERMVDQILGYLPNVALAGLVLAVGWLAARLVQRLVTQALASAGFDEFARTYRVDRVVGSSATPSAAIGVIVHVLILLPIVVAALNALQIQAVTAPAEHMLDLIIAAIPRIFAAAVLLVVSYVVARIAANLVQQLLQAVGFDHVLVRIGLQTSESPQTGGRTPSKMVGYLVMVAILLFAIMESLALLTFTNLADLLAQMLVFFAQVVTGLIVIGIGLYLANLAASTIRTSKAAQAERLALFAQVAVTVLATAIGLQQMGLADHIINLAFGLMLGAVAVAAAIAFGLGGRDYAAQELNRWLGTSSSKRSGTSEASSEEDPTS
jgi:hypothetical protein